jgi:hypothetical protein
MVLVATGVNGLTVIVGGNGLMVVAAADGLTVAAASAVAGAEDDMVSDTRLLRRVLLHRKYGGETRG